MLSNRVPVEYLFPISANNIFKEIGLDWKNTLSAVNPTCPGYIRLDRVMKHTPSWVFFQKNVHRKGCPSARIRAPSWATPLSTSIQTTQQAEACRRPWLSPVWPQDTLHHLSCVLLCVREQCQGQRARKDRGEKAPWSNFCSISLL